MNSRSLALELLLVTGSLTAAVLGEMETHLFPSLEDRKVVSKIHGLWSHTALVQIPGLSLLS